MWRKTVSTSLMEGQAQVDRRPAGPQSSRSVPPGHAPSPELVAPGRTGYHALLPRTPAIGRVEPERVDAAHEECQEAPEAIGKAPPGQPGREEGHQDADQAFP